MKAKALSNFLNAGYNERDAQSLSEQAILMVKISDKETSIDEASYALLSIMKALNIEKSNNLK